MRDRVSSILATRTARRLRVAVVVLCLLLALLAALSESRSTPASASGGDTGPVVVAVRTLPAGQVLKAADLRVAHWPHAAIPADAVVSSAQATGRRLAAPVSRGEPLTSLRLLSGDLAAGLPAGTVATSLPVDADTGRLVSAGDHVDVIATAAPDSQSRASSPVAAVVAADVLVVAVYDGSTSSFGDTAAADVVVATGRPVAVQLAEMRAVRTFTVVPDAP